ncbi:hypothetical protein QTP88_017507 [Uroleucon formosanum]
MTSFLSICSWGTWKKLRIVVKNVVTIYPFMQPTVQCDLYSILLRFRIHAVVLTTDIEKMYRQVLVAPDDQDLQRICTSLILKNP